MRFIEELKNWCIKNFIHLKEEEINNFIDSIKDNKEELEKFMLSLIFGFVN